MTVFDSNNPSNPDKPDAPKDAPRKDNDPDQPREASTTINVEQTSVAPPAPVYDEPGEIGIPNVSPEGYDPTQQPYGEKHGVPQPPKTVDEAKDQGLLPDDFEVPVVGDQSKDEQVAQAKANREAEEKARNK